MMPTSKSIGTGNVSFGKKKKDKRGRIVRIRENYTCRNNPKMLEPSKGQARFGVVRVHGDWSTVFRRVLDPIP